MYLPSSDLTSSRVGMIFRRMSPIVSISALTLRMLHRANKSIERQEQKQRHWTLHLDSLQHYNNNKNNDNFFLFFKQSWALKNKKTRTKKNNNKQKTPEHMFRSPTMDWNTSHWHAFDPCTFNKHQPWRCSTGHERKLLVLYTPPLRGYWEKQGGKKLMSLFVMIHRERWVRVIEYNIWEISKKIFKKSAQNEMQKQK